MYLRSDLRRYAADLLSCLLKASDRLTSVTPCHARNALQGATAHRCEPRQLLSPSAGVLGPVPGGTVGGRTVGLCQPDSAAGGASPPPVRQWYYLMR